LHAAQDSSEIDINVNFPEYLRFTGSAVNASRFYTVDDVKPVGNRRRGPRVLIGRLGLESNSPGLCDITFSTKNNFRLRHTVSNQRLTNYRLRYKGQNITRRRNKERTLPCNARATNLFFQAVGRFRNNPRAGVYQEKQPKRWGVSF